MQLARIHGVEPLVYDKVLSLPAANQPPQEKVLLMKQICLYSMRDQSLWKPRIEKAFASLAQAGCPAVLLKGFGLAELYPKPYLRSWSDADIWVGVANYHKACATLRGIFPDAIHHDEEYESLKHYCFVFPDGKSIELHRVAMDFPTPREERYWQTLEVPAMTAATAELGYATPSEPFNLLFVFIHAWEHFCSTGMPLKQVLDLALLTRRDYLSLDANGRQTIDCYLLRQLRYFKLMEAWQLVASVVWRVTEVQMPLFANKNGLDGCSTAEHFFQQVMVEGQCREKEYSLGGSNRYDERERAKQLPVWRRKLLTLSNRFGYARFLRAFAPRYARHILWANIRKGIRRTIKRERMIDY